MPIEIKILIIEDDVFLSDLYKTELEKNAFLVEQSFDGLDGLAKIAIFKPSLILLDLMMPEFSGIEVLQKMKTDVTHEKIPVLILTNIRDVETIKQAIALGADGYLIKPTLTPKQVVEEVQKFFNPLTNQPSIPAS